MWVKKALLAVILIYSVSSCATVLNSRMSKVSIKSSEPVDYVYEGDTLYNRASTPLDAFFVSAKEPLVLDVFNNTLKGRVVIRSRRPKLYYLNVFSPYWVGFAVDELNLNKRKWDYPRRVFIDLENNFYLPYFPMDSSFIDHNKSRISLTPLSGVGNHNPGIEASFQRNLNFKYSYQLTARSFISAGSELARNSRGYSIGGELKYFYKNTQNSRFYLSTNIEYFNKKHTANLNFVELDLPNELFPIEDITTSEIRIHKKFYSLTPRFGIEYYLTNRLVLDSFIGIGVRYRDVQHLNAPDLNHISNESGWWDITYNSNREANEFGANLDLNFKIGWHF